MAVAWVVVCRTLRGGDRSVGENYNFKTHTRKSTFREVLWGPNWQRLLSSVEQGLRAEVGVWFLRVGCGRGAGRRGRRCGGVERGKFAGKRFSF